ncbi:MAG: DUF308 domain-containing protein [Clostridiales bacterium]|nr:DUF308 domain-containing protein [Clostridiales bacterium]
MELVKKFFANMLVNAILTLVIGIVFVAYPARSGVMIVRIAGIVILIAGIVDLVRYFFVERAEEVFGGGLLSGIIEMILGIFAITHIGTLVSLLSYVIGFVIIISGVSSLSGALQLRRTEVSAWVLNIVLSLIVIFAGIVMLFFPFAAVSTAIMVAGAILIGDAISKLFTAYRMQVAWKELKRTVEDIDKEIKGNIIDV